MPLQKQPVNISFAQGIDQKSDPKALPIGKFQSLVNRVFNKTGLLEKRNGFGLITTLTGATSITTYQNGLVALGSFLQAYSADTGIDSNQGLIQPLTLSVTPMMRNATGQTTVDVAIAKNGLACSTWLDANGTSYYQIADSSTGQIVQVAVALPSTATCSRVFCLGQYFLVTFLATVSAATHLQFVAIPITNPTNPGSATDIATTPSSLAAAYDGVVAANQLYIAWNKSSTIGAAFINTELQVSTPISIASNTAQLMSLTADISSGTPVIWITWWNSSGTVIKTTAYDQVLSSTPILAPTSVVSSVTCNEITSTANNGTMHVFYEVANTYSFSPNAKTDYLAKNSCTISGTVGSASTILRNVGLGSKAVLVGSASKSYMLACYGQQYQPSYYFIDDHGNVLSRFAYENGGGYAANQILPQINLAGTTQFQVGYLYKDLIAAVNSQGEKNAAGIVPSPGGIYSQTGINLATITLGGNAQSVETASVLAINGGFLWEYDGVKPVENNFFVWPEDIQATYTENPVTPTGTASNGSNSIVLSSATGVYVGMTISDTTNATYIPNGTTIIALVGTTATMSANTTHAISGDTLSIHGRLAAQPDGTTNTDAYYYQVTYEWTNAQGNIERSAPSIPLAITTASTGSTGSVLLNLPTLRQTYKTTNKVRIVVYRWSAGQQEYYQTTSQTSPILNDPTVDSIAFVDTNSDAQIIGNNLIYTNGGVLEDLGAPSFSVLSLFDDRLWGIASEDGSLWFSKQVIPATPIEMSDELTYYVAPTIGASGSTGLAKCIFPMDDKLIIFKANALYYVNGTGPDNTGSNDQYSQPIFITSVVGSINQQSIVFTPMGLMFQSQNGIWLLGRDLSTNYIGKDVQDFNQYTVTSAVAIPGTTQVRFALNSGVALMYDYYYQQWGTFSNVNALSSTLYQGLHTFLNPYGQVVQETPGKYLDISNPVLTSWITGWINLAGLQGYQRAYALFLLGQYLTPHKLQVGLAYNYNSSVAQQTIISPTNFSSSSASPFGDEPSPFGAQTDVESWRIFLAQQRCISVQISVNEIYDPSFGVMAGAGFTLSGMNMVVGIKSGYHTISARHSAGGGQNRG